MKLNLKPESFSFFYSHLGYKIIVLLFLSILVGLADGFGLAMFLPLLEFINDGNQASSENLGNLEFILETIEGFGLSLGLESILGFMLLFFTIKGITKFTEGYYRLIVQQYFMRKLRIEGIEGLENYSYQGFTLSDPGRIQNTLSSEIPQVLAAYRAYFGALQSGVMLSVYVVLAFTANAQFALFVSIGGVLTNFLFRFVYNISKKLSRKVVAEGHDFQGFLIQLVTQFKYLKATGLIKKYGERLKSRVIIIEKLNNRIGGYANFLNSIREPITIGVVVVVIIIQVNILDQNFGLILLSLLFFYRALTFVLNLQMEWNRFLGVSGSLENITEFNRDLKSNAEVMSSARLDDISGVIRLDNVSFSYDQKQVLKNISFEIQQNSVVALVGESGSGKTTLVNLICGLIEPSNGEIKVNNRPLSDYNLEDYRKKIGYITQEPVVFNATVFDNVSFWDKKDEKNLERFWWAMEMASINMLVQEFDLQEDTMLGHNGINLSGGQKQRISIAREFYKNINLLILDEATSALDSETEADIKSSLEKIKGTLTTVVIAHRFATIREADLILFLKEGEILDVGSFEYLRDNVPEFNEAARLQNI